MIKEVDTDVSSMVKFNNHAETVQKVLNVVKKTACGVDFAIWRLENQSKIHYEMPLRHIIGDSFSYLKEYNEIAARNNAKKGFESSDEFLSNIKENRQASHSDKPVQMSVMNGDEATKAIRRSSHELAKTIQIIAMTVNAFSEDIQHSLTAGMKAHISKPVEMKVLEKTVRSIKFGNNLVSF